MAFASSLRGPLAWLRRSKALVQTTPVCLPRRHLVQHIEGYGSVSRVVPGFQEEVYVNPPLSVLLAVFGVSFTTAYVHSVFFIEHFDANMDRSFASIDRSVERTLTGATQDYMRAVSRGLQSDMSHVDWAVVGTHLMRADESEYAFNCFYIAYLGSGGKIGSYRDWMHQSLMGPGRGDEQVAAQPE